MPADSVFEEIENMREQVIEDLVDTHMPAQAHAELWDVDGLTEKCRELLGLELPIADWAAEDGVANAEINERLSAAADTAYEAKVAIAVDGQFRRVEKQVLLQVLDARWRQHLQQIDQLRSVIHLRSKGQRGPMNEFKNEAFKLFAAMLSD